MLRTLCVAASLALWLAPLVAAPVCKWVDDNGRTQVAGTVPERYKAAATCTDSQRYELSPEQQRDAEQRVNTEQARARAEALRASQAASRTPRSTDPTVPPGPLKPGPLVPGTDCPAQWQRFDESVECFAPYRTVKGGIKQEAFKYCKSVPSPEPKCGPRNQ